MPKNKWRKLGLVFNASGQAPWTQTHASLPVPEHIEGTLYRIYFSPRDAESRCHVGWLVIDIENPTKILDLSTQPVVSPGELGAFDDSGAMMSWLVRRGDRRYLYYLGWNRGVTVPFRNSLGLCVSDGGGDFVRYARGPIVDRTAHEPHFVGAGCVLVEDDLWRLWYLSCTGWRLHDGAPRHYYHIKYAESDDGINWRRDGTVAIDFRDDSEYAISRPAVVHDAGNWKMWYSYRGDRYRIGYAESEDGRAWRRLDGEAGIEASVSGWDSEMIEYPYVFDCGGRRYLLYNGNAYGRTGFGLAVQEK